MLDISKLDFQNVTNSMHAASESTQMHITQVDDQGNSEAIIINTVIQLLTNKANLIEFSNATADEIINAARQISKDLIDAVNAKLTGDKQTGTPSNIGAFIKEQLRVAVEQYLRINDKFYKLTSAKCVSDIIRNYETATTELITMAFADVVAKVNTVNLNLTTIGTNKFIDTTAVNFNAQVSQFQVAHNKLREILESSTKFTDSLQSTVHTLHTEADTTTDEVEQTAKVLKTDKLQVANKSSQVTTDTQQTKKQTKPAIKHTKTVLGQLHSNPLITVSDGMLNSIITRLQTIQKTTTATIELTTKLKPANTKSYIGRTPTLTNIVVSKTGINTQQISSGGMSGWLLTLGTIFAALAVISDNWTIALGRTSLVTAGIMRLVTNTKTYMQKQVARILTKVIGKTTLATKTITRVGSKALGLVGLGITSYGEFNEDPTEWVAASMGITVAEYRRRLATGSTPTTSAKVYNVASGGDRGFLNAIFNGLKWSAAGMFFPPLGAPIMFAVGVLANLIGRENFLRVHLAIKNIVATSTQLLKLMLITPSNITTKLTTKLTSWLGDIWLKYRTRESLVKTVNDISSTIVDISDRFTTLHEPLLAVLTQLRLARVAFANILSDDGAKLFNALLVKAKAEYRDLIEAPLLLHQKELSQKTNAIFATTQGLLATLDKAKNKPSREIKTATELTAAINKLSAIKDTVGRLANYIGTQAYEINITQQINQISADTPQQIIEPAAAFAQQMQQLYA